MKRAWLCLALFATGCTDQSMTHQPRYGWQDPAPIFANGASARPRPLGVVSQSDAARDRDSRDPPPVDAALLARGRERFDIYCAPCHGLGGDGDGVVVRRGFPPPPSFHSGALAGAEAQLFLDTIRNGYGVMYSYGDRVDPHDRWAIVAYIRALQQARKTTLAQAPEAAAKLEAERGSP